MAKQTKSLLLPPIASPWEIVSLNVDSLDVEELERRLELATADASLASWLCGIDCGDFAPPESLRVQ